MHYPSHDTIAALVTPLGRGGVAILRISGTDAIALTDPLFSASIASYRSHTVHYGEMHDKSGQRIDQVLLLLMKAPSSYTGETVIEIHCHGNPLIAKQILNALMSQGIRMAQPGEFTYRSFLNGKMDLSQAEAVQACIAAKNESALKAAQSQLQGALSQKIHSLQKNITELASLLEAYIDFPEEELETTFIDPLLSPVLSQLHDLITSFTRGKKLQEGVTLCFIGAPNVGKSSLMNCLLEKERSIVTPLPGTTRDTIEETIDIGGFPCRLIDTAGLRESSEPIEQEGIRRAEKKQQEADFLLLVLDASRPLLKEEKKWIDQLDPDTTIALWNKIDCCKEHTFDSLPVAALPISATKKWGIKELKKQLQEKIGKDDSLQEEVLITHQRHKEALEQSLKACYELKKGLQDDRLIECLAADAKKALSALNAILGRDLSEDILSEIFSRFCIGK